MRGPFVMFEFVILATFLWLIANIIHYIAVREVGNSFFCLSNSWVKKENESKLKGGKK